MPSLCETTQGERKAAEPIQLTLVPSLTATREETKRIELVLLHLQLIERVVREEPYRLQSKLDLLHSTKD